MRRFLFGAIVLAALAIVTVAGSQRTPQPQWEYLQLTPGLAARAEVLQPVGYRACRAHTAGWTCRDFEAAQHSSPHEVIAQALATLGTQGWELVAVLDETEHLSHPKGLTYLFKRARAQ